MGASYAAERGDWGSVRKELTSETFQTALTTFEQSPVPEAYQDRQSAKDEMVQKFHEAIDAAKSGSPDLQAKYEAAMQSLQQVRGSGSAEESSGETS